jgi:hypothetical protein
MSHLGQVVALGIWPTGLFGPGVAEGGVEGASITFANAVAGCVAEMPRDEAQRCATGTWGDSSATTSN